MSFYSPINLILDLCKKFYNSNCSSTRIRTFFILGNLFVCSFVLFCEVLHDFLDSSIT